MFVYSLREGCAGPSEYCAADDTRSGTSQIHTLTNRPWPAKPRWQTERHPVVRVVLSDAHQLRMKRQSCGGRRREANRSPSIRAFVSWPQAHENRTITVGLSGGRYVLSSHSPRRRSWRDDFRTPASVHARGYGDVQPLGNCTPTQILFIPKPHNLVTPKNAPGPSKRFTVRARCTNAGRGALPNQLQLKSGHR
jgi:hypothetical protein